MSLDYEYATVDVDLLVHPKAIAAGVEAMGLWLWGMAWAHKSGTDGLLPAHVVVTAWGAPRTTITRLAQRLVAAGLWLVDATTDGWRIWNYEKKNQSAAEKNRRRELGRERMRRLRARSRDDARDRHGDASRDAHVHDESAAPDLISSGYGSLSEADREIPPVGTDPPAWWGQACDAAAMSLGGAVDDRGARWVEYRAARERKGWAMNHGDALAWLTTVLRSERRNARAGPRRGSPVQSAENRAWIVPKDMP